MPITTLRVPAVDLEKIEIRNVRDQKYAVDKLNNQIECYLIENNILHRDSIMMNKLVYYCAKSIRKKNPKFVINTGWYLYGPCYENGRRNEGIGKQLPTISIAADEYNDIIARPCNEITEKYYKARKDDSIFESFLSWIYNDMCDKPKLKEWFVAKHTLMCSMHHLNEYVKQSNWTDAEKQLKIFKKSIIECDKVFLSTAYPKHIGLDDELIEKITTNTCDLYEYLVEIPVNKLDVNRVETAQQYLHKNLLSPIADLNYSYSFECLIRRHEQNVKDTFKTTGIEELKKSSSLTGM